jgi:predicted CopG family antitoxin
MNIQCSSKNRRCTVLLSEEVYQRLRKKGLFGESFSDLINRLLTETDKLKDEENNGKY